MGCFLLNLGFIQNQWLGEGGIDVKFRAESNGANFGPLSQLGAELEPKNGQTWPYSKPMAGRGVDLMWNFELNPMAQIPDLYESRDNHRKLPFRAKKQKIFSKKLFFQQNFDTKWLP